MGSSTISLSLNTIINSDYRSHYLNNIITPRHILLWIDKFLLFLTLLLEIILNMMLSKRDMQWRMRMFRRRTNKIKITERWETNRNTWKNSVHYIDLTNPTPNNCLLYYYLSILQFINIGISDVFHHIWNPCLSLPYQYNQNNCDTYSKPPIKTNII